MFYLAGKILLYLLFSAVLGFAIGWFLKEFIISKKINNLRLLNTQTEDQIFALREENKELHKQLKQSINTRKPGSEKTAKDNLQLINGIGQVLEKRLNKLGVYTLSQIAIWKKSDVEKISMQIGPFKNRIIHDNWIGQAQKITNKV